MRSLLFHMKRHIDISDLAMDLETRTRVVNKILLDLKPARWEIPEDFLSFSHFYRVVKDLDYTSSPGYPYMRTATNIRDFLKVDSSGEPHPEKLNYLWSLVKNQIATKKADPIRMFIKPEPISLTKVKDKRYRIISAVSLVDQIIDHMLFANFNHKLVENCQRTPVKTGWTPIQGGWKVVPRLGMVSTDKSSFDWTVRPWMLDVELEIRTRLCNNVTEEWKQMAKWRYEQLFNRPLFINSAGIVFRSNISGIMKSGCVNTISTNSIIQLIIHYRVSAELNQPFPYIWAMGDDVIQEDSGSDYFTHLERYCILKEKTTHVEFAGYRYNGYNVEPLYFGKHAYVLLHQKLQYITETANAYALLYHRSKRASKIKTYLRQLNPELISDDVLDDLWDNES
ncbi:hypothetical protein 2 [Hubei sobemo-like virus 36]|uniref:hypothetical protein 2 n=1 Tax=Hubei sobemo-like virus 36 TaxID=1923223 RepID=UPI00090C033A|nr:hypothetical protein 2 [Hubei sobemo-like virus 36]APG75832.1 hypothetical protein 2 [Hubei sobemo-like virus 36]